MAPASSNAFQGPARLRDLSARMLGEAMADLGRWRQHPVWGARASPMPAWDARLQELGREWVAALAPSPAGHGETDVLLATQIYKDGGHTALMGDFANALARASGSTPRVWATDLLGHNSRPPRPAILSRLGSAASDVTILAGSTPVEKLIELVRLIEEVRPRRVFLFHHPDDPLPVVAAQAEWASRQIIVHHADSTPCFGLCLPHALLIDLNPTAAAQSRLHGLCPQLLPLTAPDPGRRPASFLSEGRLVTATAARGHKLTGNTSPCYAETIPVLLQATGGRHVHIGELPEEMLVAIQDALAAAGLPGESFLYRKRVPSLPHALWEHRCDLYLASFPIDGARTNVEVAASATPHLRHMPPDRKSSLPGGFPLEGGLVWGTWDDLRAILAEVKSVSALEGMSRRIRATYEERHSPERFAATLDFILRGHRGYSDPHQEERDLIARESHRRACLRAGDEPPVRPACA